MREKCIRNLPSLRVSEPVETALMRLAARDERSLSEYIRLVLEHHVFGHGASVREGGAEVTDFGALQRSAGER